METFQKLLEYFLENNGNFSRNLWKLTRNLWWEPFKKLLVGNFPETYGNFPETFGNFPVTFGNFPVTFGNFNYWLETFQ